VRAEQLGDLTLKVAPRFGADLENNRVPTLKKRSSSSHIKVLGVSRAVGDFAA
jgi:hypothetical protein